MHVQKTDICKNVKGEARKRRKLQLYFWLRIEAKERKMKDVQLSDLCPVGDQNDKKKNDDERARLPYGRIELLLGRKIQSAMGSI